MWEERLLNEMSLLDPVMVRVLLDQRLSRLRDVGGDLSLAGHFYINVEQVAEAVENVKICGFFRENAGRMRPAASACWGATGAGNLKTYSAKEKKPSR